MREPGPSGASPSPGVTRLLPDAQLVRRAAKGDKRAFAAIYQRYGQNLYRFCLSIVGRAEDAQDALQNTMVKALRSLPGEQRRIQLKPWLYRVAHNESIELLRKRREGAELDPELISGGPELSETAANRDRLRHLLADLSELPERQRGAVVMRELAGLDFAQIGEALDTSAAVARQTVYEARLNLRQLEEGREMSCEKVMWRLSETDGRTARRRDIQAHLRACPTCREFRDSIAARRDDLAALAPLPAVASAGLLQALLGGGSSGLGGGVAGVGVGAGKVVAGGTIAKSAATVAVVAAVGVSAADRGGLIDVGVGGDKDARSSPTARPVSPTPPSFSTGSGTSPSIGGARAGLLNGQRIVIPGPGRIEARVQTAGEAGRAREPGTPSGALPLPPQPTGPPHPKNERSEPLPSAASKGSGNARGPGNGHGHDGANGGGKATGRGNGRGQSGKPPGHSASAAKPTRGGRGEKQPPPHAQSNKGPSSEHVAPDKSQGPPLEKPEQPTNPGAPEAGAHPPKEAG